MLPVRRPLALLVLAVLALAVALTGCGDDAEAKNDYVAKVNVVQERLATAYATLAGTLTAASTPLEDLDALKTQRTAIDAFVRDLRAIDPPGELETLHGQLVERVGAYGQAISAAEEAYGPDASCTPSECATAQTQFTAAARRATTAFNETIGAINRKLRE